MLQAAKDGKKINTIIHLIQPKDHTDDYDRVIGMLKMSVDNEIIVDDSDYRKFILDQWDWSRQFSSSSASYSASSSSSSDLKKFYL